MLLSLGLQDFGSNLLGIYVPATDSCQEVIHLAEPKKPGYPLIAFIVIDAEPF